MTEATVPPIPHTDGSSPVLFTGVRADFRRLIMRGAALEFITLGFYRFWLATDMRRHLWSHTSVGDDAPEYTGTAKELLIGFLFALAILAPLYLVYFLIGMEAELWQAFASVPLVIFFYLFYQFAIYRARRYRLTRTVWRGVRFWMTGSGWSYAWRAGLWMLWSIITLGLALPWAQAALERYKMKHSFFGDLPGRFEGTGGGLFKQVWWLWLVTLLFVLVVVGGSVLAAPPVAELLGKRFGVWVSAEFLNFVPLIVVLYLVWLPFGLAIYKALEWRWWLFGIRFGDVRFESDLSAGALIGPFWKVIGWSFLILFGFVFWASAALFTFLAAAGGLNDSTPEVYVAAAQNPIFLVVGLVGYVIAALAVGVVVRLYLRRDVWARVVGSATVYNLSAVDSVVARGQAANALGEGFADGLDVGGI